MPLNSVDVIRIPTSGPGNIGPHGADRRRSGAGVPILAVLGKTEGNGGVNDFAGSTVAALCNAPSPHLKLAPRAVNKCVRHVGRRGCCAAYDNLPERPPRQGSRQREATEHQHSAYPRFPCEEIGRNAQIYETMHAVRLAMRNSKSTTLTTCIASRSSARCRPASASPTPSRGKTVVTASGYASMGYTHGDLGARGRQGAGRNRSRCRSVPYRNWDLFSSSPPLRPG